MSLLKPIPLMDINNAEVLAISRAIQISLTTACIESHGLIIESDSANTVKWCNGMNNGPWNLAFHINLIRQHHKSDLDFEVVYKSRETNMVADALAKQGLSRQDDFVAWI